MFGRVSIMFGSTPRSCPPVRFAVAFRAATMPFMDARPPVWVGHIVLFSRDIVKSSAFWKTVIPRDIHIDSEIAIFELRGGTHLLILPGDPKPGAASFDLMVDDLDATHAEWSAAGLNPSAIMTDRPGHHSAFDVRDPDGYVVTVSNSHVEGPV